MRSLKEALWACSKRRIWETLEEKSEIVIKVMKEEEGRESGINTGAGSLPFVPFWTSHRRRQTSKECYKFC